MLFVSMAAAQALPSLAQAPAQKALPTCVVFQNVTIPENMVARLSGEKQEFVRNVSAAFEWSHGINVQVLDVRGGPESPEPGYGCADRSAVLHVRELYMRSIAGNAASIEMQISFRYKDQPFEKMEVAEVAAGDVDSAYKRAAIWTTFDIATWLKSRFAATRNPASPR